MQAEIRQNLPDTIKKRKSLLLKLKKRLLRGAETFANPVYAEQFQQNCLEKAGALAEAALRNEIPVCFVTINVCRGRGENKTTHWLSCEEVGDFGVCGAINTIRKQFIGLGVAGYMSLEIKWDERFQLFLPHVHALVMGMKADKLKDGLKAIYPNNENAAYQGCSLNLDKMLIHWRYHTKFNQAG